MSSAPGTTGRRPSVTRVTHDRRQGEFLVEFASRMIVYVGSIVFAVVFYRNIADMVVEARTMPMMGIIAVVGLASVLLLSDLVRAVRARSLTAAIGGPPTEAEDAEPRSESADADSRLDPDDVSDDPAAELAAELAAESDPTEQLKPQAEFGGDNLQLRRVLRFALPAAVLVAVYIYLLPIVGFVFGSIGFLGLLAVLLGARSIIKVAVFAVTFPIAFQYLFEELLQLRLP